MATVLSVNISDLVLETHTRKDVLTRSKGLLIHWALCYDPSTFEDTVMMYLLPHHNYTPYFTDTPRPLVSHMGVHSRQQPPISRVMGTRQASLPLDRVCPRTAGLSTHVHGFGVHSRGNTSFLGVVEGRKRHYDSGFRLPPSPVPFSHSHGQSDGLHYGNKSPRNRVRCVMHLPTIVGECFLTRCSFLMGTGWSLLFWLHSALHGRTESQRSVIVDVSRSTMHDYKCIRSSESILPLTVPVRVWVGVDINPSVVRQPGEGSLCRQDYCTLVQ